MSIRLPSRSKRQLVIATFAIVLPLGAVAATQLAPPPSSPATGHAQVITQGVVKLGNEPMVWRVVQRIAKPRWQAEPAERVLGFVMASDEPILLSNVSSSGRTRDVARLGVGEAFLVTAGTDQIRASMSDNPVTYLAMELVPESEAGKIAGGKVLYTSDAFTPPPGQRDIDFVRNVLRPREVASLPDSGQPVYILATDGAIDVLPAGGKTTTLEAGESGIFSGELKIKAVAGTADSGDQVAAAGLTAGMLLQDGVQLSGYVVTVIGEEIGPVQTPTPTPVATATSTPAPVVVIEEPTVPVVEEPTTAPEPTLPPEPTIPPEPTEPVVLDADQDGIPDDLEPKYGTDPLNPDSDDDGLRDGDEANVYFTVPTAFDTDQDGLSDGAEVLQYGTDPLNRDTDGDETSDGREVAAGRDPLDPNN